jgi:2-oxoglutarate ferredoxin oxidoreductase subunit alpha
VVVNPDDRRFTAVGIPITGATVEAVGGTSKDKGKNLFVLGLIARVFNLDVAKIAGLISERFGGKSEDIVRNAMLAFDAGFATPADNLRDSLCRFEGVQARPSGRPRVSMDGNQALTYGLIAAGVRFGAGYPITPWSTVMETLRAELPKYGGIFVQAEDELAAVGYALGFAYSGHLAVTGSSGPGLSLKMEGLGWAVMSEMPLIVINVQRGGPSTGLPTNVEQSDLMQAIYGSHGDTPRVVLAPKDVEDCFYIALEAGRIARKYSTPVLILTDQSLATRIEAFEEPDLPNLMTDPKPDLSPRGLDFQPYPLDGITRHAPPGASIATGKYPSVSGLEHDEMGHPSGNPAMHQKMTEKRREKIKALAASLSPPDVHGDQEGDVLIVGWGSTWGPIREAVNKLRREGMRVGQLHLRHLHPLPQGLDGLFVRYRRVLVVEMNDEGLYGFGQMAMILRGRYALPSIGSITKTDGLTFRIGEIVNGVKREPGHSGHNGGRV